MKKTPYLEFADNMLGKLKPEIIKRINKYLKNPTVCGWEDVHCIIINGSGKMTTIWQAVIKVDPFFPNWGRRTDIKGNVLKDWDRIPDPETVIEAINLCVLSKQLSNQLN